MIAAALKHMLAAGMDHDAIVAAVVDMEASIGKDEQAERRRAKDRDRKRLRNSAESAEKVETVSPKKEIPPTPPKEKTTPSISVSVGAREFDRFWSLFPNKVGKRDAEKAFAAALQRADLETILAGLERYAAKTDDRPWCNPATFLNQDRWADQPASLAPRRQSTAPPPREPRNAGERAYLKLQEQNDEPPSTRNGRLDPGDGRRQIEGTGIARRFAVAAVSGR